jgi:hypothetical protein
MYTRKLIIANRHNKTILLLTLLVVMGGCSTYPNKFKCDDARGLGCTMLHEVDKQIDSGQIAEAYKKKKCSGNKCKNEPLDDGLILKREDQAVRYEDEDITPLSDGKNIYF